MFGDKGVKDISGHFKYSIQIYGEVVVDNQPLSSSSLRAAIQEAVNFEAAMQPTLGLQAIKMLEISKVTYNR